MKVRYALASTSAAVERDLQSKENGGGNPASHCTQLKGCCSLALVQLPQT